MAERQVGVVTNYYSKIGVAAVELEAPLQVGDRVHIAGATTDLELVVESIQVDHQPVDSARPGDDVAIKVTDRVRGGDKVLLEVHEG